MRTTLLIGSALTLAACAACSDNKTTGPDLSDIPSAEQLVAAAEASGLVRMTFPDPDPGIPIYARAETTQNQLFRDGEWLAIPFYRPPASIPADFNMLDYFDFPGPDGPGAFGTPLVVSGFYMIEPDAPLGTFPKVAITTGTAVPVWFVRWADFAPLLATGSFTVSQLEALQPLKGTATRYIETLRPRGDEHLVVISSAGTLPDGRQFDFSVTHVGDVTRAINIQFRR